MVRRLFEAESHHFSARGSPRVAGDLPAYSVAGGTEEGGGAKPADFPVSGFGEDEAGSKEGFTGGAKGRFRVASGPGSVFGHLVNVGDRRHVDGPWPEGAGVYRAGG